MSKHIFKVKLLGYKKYPGDYSSICHCIIKDCYNGNYFKVSSGNYNTFYSRDFGFCTDSLLSLGYRTEVRSTLEFISDVFVKNNCITVAVTPSNVPFNFPNYFSPDSVAYFYRSLLVSGSSDIINENIDFYNNMLDRYFKTVVDPNTGLVRKDKVFSSMKDYSVRQSSCYDNVMTAMLSNVVKKIKVLDNPFREYDYKRLIKDTFWRENFFLDDCSGAEYVAADANLYPFHFEIFNSRKMLKNAILRLQEDRLDLPFPIKYHHRTKEAKFIPIQFLVPNWESDSVWAHMASVYIELLHRIDKDKAKDCLLKYVGLVERHKNFFEVYSSSKKPYKSFFYVSDEGMLWSSNFLALQQKIFK